MIFRRPAKPRPRKREALTEQQTTAGGGLTPMLYLERWGNMTNRLTPSRLSSILQAADDGDITEQHVLFADMEDRCEHLAAEIGKRKRALLTLDWEILPGRAKDKRAEDVAAAVREQFDMLPTTSDLLLDLADGIGHGFAALEIEWTQTGGLHIPAAFHHRPQSWFQVMRENRNILRLRDGSYEGAELWPFGWVIHTHRSKSGWLPRVGLFRTVAWAYLIRAYALESAIMYTQVHGLPFRLGKYPPGSSAEDRLPVRFCSMARYVSSSRPRSLRAICNFAMRERLVSISAPHKVVNGVKLNAAVHHDGHIPTPVGGTDRRARHIAGPVRRRAGNTARHFDAGLHRQVRHGYRDDLAARRELGGKGGDFAGAEEQLSILQIVPAPIEPNLEAPGGAAVVFRRGKFDLHAVGAKTYTNRAAENFIRACHFPHRSRVVFGAGAVGATALRASQHTLSMFSAASGASLSIKKVATIRFFAVS